MPVAVKEVKYSKDGTGVVVIDVLGSYGNVEKIYCSFSDECTLSHEKIQDIVAYYNEDIYYLAYIGGLKNLLETISEIIRDARHEKSCSSLVGWAINNFGLSEEFTCPIIVLNASNEVVTSFIVMFVKFI